MNAFSIPTNRIVSWTFELHPCVRAVWGSPRSPLMERVHPDPVPFDLPDPVTEPDAARAAYEMLRRREQEHVRAGRVQARLVELWRWRNARQGQCACPCGEPGEVARCWTGPGLPEPQHMPAAWTCARHFDVPLDQVWRLESPRWSADTARYIDAGWVMAPLSLNLEQVGLFCWACAALDETPQTTPRWLSWYVLRGRHVLRREPRLKDAVAWACRFFRSPGQPRRNRPGDYALHLSEAGVDVLIVNGLIATRDYAIDLNALALPAYPHISHPSGDMLADLAGVTMSARPVRRAA
ncbi:hypothetical protein [Bailinhaonella thermotolerans]|uniref:Uncharacterized protein n=1 Tax=Bailinhaonella thermotolerans TaxID=1070861 RepID=A0A3A4A316_9ACTN|nr:hypothetical protein [Bailinhaonella thermotolerans]RJL19572.1 hypothetical protein D5H75_40245 [Bailinhaonella thermotolerans]